MHALLWLQDNTTVAKCYDWDETKCAKGFVQKNYTDNSRINHIVPKSNVKLINSDDLKIYGCPFEESLLIVSRQSRFTFQKDDVISSSQAEGIFHKITDIVSTGNVPRFINRVFCYSASKI